MYNSLVEDGLSKIVMIIVDQGSSVESSLRAEQKQICESFARE